VVTAWFTLALMPTFGFSGLFLLFAGLALLAALLLLSFGRESWRIRLILLHNIGLCAARDSELIQRNSAVTAVEVAASGIKWAFAPTLAVPHDLRWSSNYEGYAANPALVARYGRAMTISLQARWYPASH